MIDNALMTDTHYKIIQPHDQPSQLYSQEETRYDQVGTVFAIDGIYQETQFGVRSSQIYLHTELAKEFLNNNIYNRNWYNYLKWHLINPIMDYQKWREKWRKDYRIKINLLMLLGYDKGNRNECQFTRLPIDIIKIIARFIKLS